MAAHTFSQRCALHAMAAKPAPAPDPPPPRPQRPHFHPHPCLKPIATSEDLENLLQQLATYEARLLQEDAPGGPLGPSGPPAPIPTESPVKRPSAAARSPVAVQGAPAPGAATGERPSNSTPAASLSWSQTLEALGLASLLQEPAAGAAGR
jgi:hypothetical protein